MSKAKQKLIRCWSVLAALILSLGLWSCLQVKAEDKDPFEVWNAVAFGNKYYIDVRSEDMDGQSISNNVGLVSVNGYDVASETDYEYYAPSAPNLGAIRIWTSSYNPTARNIIVFREGFQTSGGNAITEEIAFECVGTEEWKRVTDDAHIAIWPMSGGFIDIRSPQSPAAAWDTSVNEGKVMINGQSIENTPTHTDYYYGGNAGAVRVFPVAGTWNENGENTLVLKAGFSVAEGVSLLQDRTYVCMGNGAWTEKVTPPAGVQDDAEITSVDKFAWAPGFGYYLEIRSEQFDLADKAAQAEFIELNGITVGTQGLGLEYLFEDAIRVNTYGEGAWEKIDENGYQTLVFKKGFLTSSAHRLAQDVRFICKLTANPDGAKPAASTDWIKVGAAPANFSVGGIKTSAAGIAEVCIVWGDSYFGLTKADLQNEAALLEKITFSTDGGTSFAPVAAYDPDTKTGVKITQSAFSLRLENYANDVLSGWAAGTRIRFAEGMSLDGSANSADATYILQTDGTWLTEAESLAQAKTDAIAELNGYKLQNDYLADNWKTVQSIIVAATETINVATTEAAIEEAVADAKEKMDAVPTLRNVKDAAIEELHGYKNESDYSAAGWAIIEGIVEEGTVAINAANSQAAIDEAVRAAKAEMDEVLTAEEEAAALAQAKEEAMAELNGYVSEADYSAANWEEIQAIIASAGSEIEAATDRNDVAQILTDAKASIDAIPTLTEEAETLAQAKRDAIAELSGYASEADYSAEGWALIESIVEEGTAAINAATDQAAVANVLRNAKADIDAILTLTEEAEALEQAKISAVAELNGYKAQNTYTTESAALVENVVKEWTADINAATSEAAVVQALTDAKAAIDTIPTLEESRAAAIAILNGYKSESDYSETNWDLIQADIASASEKINAATSQSVIDAAVEEAKIAMDAIETKAQTEARLTEAKQQAEAELDAYKSESDYTAENWASLQEIVAQAKANIRAAMTVSDVQSILAEAKEDMDAVPTAEDGANNSGTDAPAKSGCGSSVYAGISVLGAVVLAAAVSLMIRKKDNV